MAFVHLHTHSEYSLLDGANRIPDLLDRVQALGMDSLAITDHGNLHGAWQFYTEAKARNVRPILGFEAYLAFGSRLKRERPTDAPAVYSHLVLLARNRRGDRKSTRLNSSHPSISYAVFCLKKKIIEYYKHFFLAQQVD